MYTLSRAVAIVRRMDDSSVRDAVFQSVYNSSRLVRVATDIYNISPTSLKALILLIYGAKCFISVKIGCGSGSKFLLMGAYPNDVKALTNLETCLPQDEVSWINLSIRNSTNYTSIKKFRTYLMFSRRLYRFGSKIAKRHGFMPACRIFSVMAYYKMFLLLLQEQKYSVIIIANHYGPESLALATAAHSMGSKVVVTNHAITANEDALGLPVHADLLVCSGDAMKDVLQSEAPSTIDHCYFPLDIPSREMCIPEVYNKSVVVGIFLTALTNIDQLDVLVSRLYSTEWCCQIRVRQHPAKIVNTDCDSLGDKYPDLVFSEHISLQEDIAKCDIAICGNSTVVVEILRGGKPVTYLSTLDFLPKDYARFVYRGLLPECPIDELEHLIPGISRHYQNDFWIRKMCYFDACYLQDDRQMKEECTTMLLSVSSVKDSDSVTPLEYLEKAG